MFELIIFVITFLFLSICAFLDLRTREIPDYVNYTAIAIGIGVRLLYSVFMWDFYPFTYGLLGFGAAFLLGCIMFYTGQWGGGDSKALMGVGALLGIDFTLWNTFFVFLIFVIISGGIYNLIWCSCLALKHHRIFFTKTQQLLRENKKLHLASLFTAIFLLAFSFFLTEFLFLLFIFFTLFTPFFFYLFIFVKSVEECCMLRRVEPRELTEGDWIAEDVLFKGKRITGPKDLGVSKQQIRQLVTLYSQKKIKKVLLKTGIPFTPTFWLAFVTMIVLEMYGIDPTIVLSTLF